MAVGAATVPIFHQTPQNFPLFSTSPVSNIIEATSGASRGYPGTWELLFLGTVYFKEVWTNALHRFTETIVTPASIGYTISNAQNKKAACPLQDMPKKIRELKAMLRKAGFLVRPGKGSHTVWEHPELPEESFTFAGKDGDDAQRYQTKRVEELLNMLKRKRSTR